MDHGVPLSPTTPSSPVAQPVFAPVSAPAPAAAVAAPAERAASPEQEIPQAVESHVEPTPTEPAADDEDSF